MIAVPAHAQLSDKTGWISKLHVDAGGQGFEVLVTANFDVPRASFSLEEKTLTLSIASSLKNNLGEITVPRTLLGGELTFMLDDQEYLPRVRSNDRIWFITAEFGGTGMHTMKIIGTESIRAPGAADLPRQEAGTDDGSGGGCLVATAAYGSEMAPQVQLLREIRDGTVLNTRSGSAFMAGFGQLYYSFSPTVADWERQSPAFREAVKAVIAPLLSILAVLSHVDIDSEHEMLGYGLGVIAMSAGVYIGPVIGLAYLRRLLGFMRNRPE